MTDPTHDTLTITEDPPLTVTRSESGDIHIVGSSEGVTVPLNAIHPLQSALEAFKGTPADAPDMPAGLTEAIAEESGSGCPECGSDLVHEMGSEAQRCPECGWSE